MSPEGFCFIAADGKNSEPISDKFFLRKIALAFLNDLWVFPLVTLDGRQVGLQDREAAQEERKKALSILPFQAEQFSWQSKFANAASFSRS